MEFETYSNIFFFSVLLLVAFLSFPYHRLLFHLPFFNLCLALFHFFFLKKLNIKLKFNCSNFFQSMVPIEMETNSKGKLFYFIDEGYYVEN